MIPWLFGFWFGFGWVLMQRHGGCLRQPEPWFDEVHRKTGFVHSGLAG
jgi:hypothetical protein